MKMERYSITVCYCHSQVGWSRRGGRGRGSVGGREEWPGRETEVSNIIMKSTWKVHNPRVIILLMCVITSLDKVRRE